VWLGRATLIASAPLLLLYWQRPEMLLAHLRQTHNITPGDPALTLQNGLDGLVKVWLSFSIRGDMMPGRNVVGRPLFDIFASVLLWIGLLSAAWRARRVPAAQLLLLWVIVMSMPAAVTNQVPAFPRMLPLTPALAGLAGLGAAVAWEVLSRERPVSRRLALAALGVGLSLGIFSSLWAYWVEWPTDPRSFDARNFGPRRVADQALALAATDQVLVTPRSNPFAIQAFQLLLDGTPVETFDANADCLPYAHDRPQPTTYGLIQVMDASTLPTLQAAYPSGDEVAHILHPDGYAYAVFFRVPAGTPAPAPQHHLQVEFADGLRLVGVDAPPQARPGEAVSVTLYWEASQPLSEPLTGFVHIGKGRASQPLVGQDDAPPCPGLPGDLWQPGYRYLDNRSIRLAQDAPLDLYDIRMGVYDPTRNARVTILSADRPFQDDRVLLGDFRVIP
jgi:hypothetical protein